MSIGLTELKTEYMTKPLGMDCACPRFSWKLVADADERDVVQNAYCLRVGHYPGADDVWNSGWVASGESGGVSYEGPALEPCTRYYWQVSVQAAFNRPKGAPGQSGSVCPEAAAVSSERVCLKSHSGEWFETGFLDDSLSAWSGARWIGPKYLTVSPDVKGVFGLETAFWLAPGSRRAGVILGYGDRRIKDRENYFRFEVDVSRMPARLKIYRVGIVPEDRADVPVAEVDIVDRDDGGCGPVITDKNKYGRHVLRIDVTGNGAVTYVDGKKVDVTTRKMPWGGVCEAPRQLNPLGDNDVITFPRLNNIGFYVPEGQTAFFEYIRLRHLRKPYAVFFEETAADGMNEACTGKTGSIFKEALGHGRMTIEAGHRTAMSGYCGMAPDCRGAADDGRTAADLYGAAAWRISAVQGDVLVAGNPGHTSIPMLRRSFTVEDKPVASARLYASARGIYECRVNGRPVTDTWFNPGQTQYDRHLMYQTYDLSEFLVPGENAVGVILASGWWSDAQTFELGNYNYYGDRESFLGKLVITYTDGTQTVIVTGTSEWKYSPDGPWTYAGLFHGEHYDAVRGEAFEHFDMPGYDDSLWIAPEEIAPVPIGEGEVMGHGPIHWPYVNQQEPKMTGQAGGRIYAAGELEARSVCEIAPGVYIFDMGYNVAGVPKVHLCGIRGTQATLRFAEVLCPELPEFKGRAATLMTENLRDADCTDLYTFRGCPEGEDYMPHFTFRGFRYIEIRGVTRMPRPDEVHLVKLSSLRELPGNVRVSNELVNCFTDNVRRSQQSNFISIPTDCPQRNERMGWDGDTSVFARTASFYGDTRQFYSQWLQAMRDLQENGRYPDIAPVGGGFGGYTYESAGLHVTWEVYQQYGDVRVVEDNYDAMRAFMDYSADVYAHGGLVTPGTLGDWLSPQETDTELICLAFYGYNAYIMARMAECCGRRGDALHYGQLYRSLKAEFNERFIDAHTGRTVCDTQCSYALPLAFHMIADESAGLVGERLAERVARDDYRVMTGFFGTAPLNPMLTTAGHKEAAYRLMEQTRCPSWLYPVTQGATSIWERWDSYTKENGFGGHNNMNSFNHYSLGAVCEWLYMYVLGIRRDESRPGYRHFFAQPEIACWDFARGSFESPYGTVGASWERLSDGEYHYCLCVPPNTSATVILPDGYHRTVGSGSYTWHVNIRDNR